MNQTQRRRRAAPGAPQRFVEHAATYDGDDCLLWPFSVSKYGYGIHTYRRADGTRSSTTAHSAVLALVQPPPPLPEGQRRWEASHAPVVCHNRLCCNPRHLEWKSPKANAADRYLDRTSPPASRPDYVSQRDVAEAAGVAQTTVSRLLNGHYVAPATAARINEAIERLGYEYDPIVGGKREFLRPSTRRPLPTH